MLMTEKKPHTLSPDERANEVATIFAAAFVRIKEKNKSTYKSADYSADLTGLKSGSKHELDTNQKEKTYGK